MNLKPHEISGPVHGTATEAESALFDMVEAQAEHDVEEEILDRRNNEERTTIRWPREQLERVRQAAAAYGMPYQNYIRDAAFRRALEDLRALREPASTT